MSPLVELTLARLRLFLREPSAVFWTFGFPMLLSVALGSAFRNRPATSIPVAIAATADSAEAQRLLGALSSPLVRAIVVDPKTADRRLRSAQVALVLEPGPPHTYRYDETRPEGRLARLVVDDVLQRAAGRVDPAAFHDERVTAVGARYIDFLIPGLVGLNLMSSSMWGIGYSIVEMRTKKLIKRLLATPMRRMDFLLSFAIMRIFFVVMELPVLFGFGWAAFGVRVVGSWALLFGLALLGAFSFAGLGMLVASRAQNTQTVGGLMNLVMMPMFITSGVFFSTANFPDAMQPLLRALPLTALNDSLRAVCGGATLAEVARPAGILAVWGAASYAGALKLFRWL